MQVLAALKFLSQKCRAVKKMKTKAEKELIEVCRDIAVSKQQQQQLFLSSDVTLQKMALADLEAVWFALQEFNSQRDHGNVIYQAKKVQEYVDLSQHAFYLNEVSLGFQKVAQLWTTAAMVTKALLQVWLADDIVPSAFGPTIHWFVMRFFVQQKRVVSEKSFSVKSSLWLFRNVFALATSRKPGYSMASYTLLSESPRQPQRENTRIYSCTCREYLGDLSSAQPRALRLISTRTIFVFWSQKHNSGRLGAMLCFIKLGISFLLRWSRCQSVRLEYFYLRVASSLSFLRMHAVPK